MGKRSKRREAASRASIESDLATATIAHEMYWHGHAAAQACNDLTEILDLVGQAADQWRVDHDLTAMPEAEAEMLDKATTNCKQLPYNMPTLLRWPGLQMTPGQFIPGLLATLGNHLAAMRSFGCDMLSSPLMRHLREDALAWHWCRLASECYADMFATSPETITIAMDLRETMGLDPIGTPPLVVA